MLFELHDIPSVEASASSPDQAMERLQSEPVGVVIQDMNFVREKTTGEEGIELFQRVRRHDAEIPVLLMTAWASLETAVQLIKDGATDYLAKPWDDDKLLVSVQNLLRMRSLQLENARLQGERRQAREDLARDHDLCGLVYESNEMHRLVGLALNVAASDAPVMITGPSGAGKEKLAEIVQANSRRKQRPFVRVNVGALPDRADGGRAVRCRGRRLHRCEHPPHRALRGGGRRHAVPGRDRRPSTLGTGQAAARGAERRVPAAGAAARRCAPMSG